MNINLKQVGGTHYKRGTVQHWDVVATFGIGYLEGCCTKYLLRWRDKAGIQDLEKSEHFLEKLIDMVECGAVSSNRAKIREVLLKRFYTENKIPYPESLIIDTVFRWKNTTHLHAALSKLRGFTDEQRGGPTSAYVNQD